MFLTVTIFNNPGGNLCVCRRGQIFNWRGVTWLPACSTTLITIEGDFLSRLLIQLQLGLQPLWVGNVYFRPSLFPDFMSLSEGVSIGNDKLTEFHEYSTTRVWAHDVIHQAGCCGNLLAITPLRVGLKVLLIFNLMQDFSAIIDLPSVLFLTRMDLTNRILLVRVCKELRDISRSRVVAIED